MDELEFWNYDWLIRRFKSKKLNCEYCLNVFIGTINCDAAMWGAGVRIKRNMLYSHYFCIEDAKRFLRKEIARYDRVLAWLTKRKKKQERKPDLWTIKTDDVQKILDAIIQRCADNSITRECAAEKV